MKKFLVILFFCLILITVPVIGYQVVSANEMVDEIQDIRIEQGEVENYLSSYGYTIDNPNIIVNPYGISPLTALILFETESNEKVTITVEGKDEKSTYTNTFESSKKHYIPVYGLYPDYENKISIGYGNITKTFIIQTEPLPNHFKIEQVTNDTNELMFITNDEYPYALDCNNEVRWYLTHKYSGKTTRLENGHFLLSNDMMIEGQLSNGLVEIDLLGKIYKQYHIEEGYYGSFVEIDYRLFVLSKDLLEIDTQSGVIVQRVKLDEEYDSISYNQETQMLELHGRNGGLLIKKDTMEQASSVDISARQEEKILLPLYVDNKEYKIVEGIKFSNSSITKESNQHVFLLGYKKIDKEYEKYQIQVKKGADYLQITGKFGSNDEVLIILDKFLDKRIYDMNSNHVVINKGNLKGKYSIYIKINDTIYKTNSYVAF